MALGTTIHPTAVMITPGKQIPGVKIQVLAVHLRVIIVFQIYNNSTVQQIWDFSVLDQVQSPFLSISFEILGVKIQGLVV